MSLNFPYHIHPDSNPAIFSSCADLSTFSMSLGLIFLRKSSALIEIVISADIFDLGFTAVLMGGVFIRTVTDPGQLWDHHLTYRDLGVVHRDKEHVSE